MSQGPDPERLRQLEEKIAKVKGVEEGTRFVDEHHAQVQHGWRMVTELVAGLLIGFGIGFGLDKVFGTLPLFLILFTLLGFVAGIRVMMRTAAEMQREQETPQSGTNEKD